MNNTIFLGLKQGLYAYFKLPLIYAEFLGQTNSRQIFYDSVNKSRMDN